MIIVTYPRHRWVHRQSKQSIGSKQYMKITCSLWFEEHWKQLTVHVVSPKVSLSNKSFHDYNIDH
jgi:hypothetical protein